MDERRNEILSVQEEIAAARGQARIGSVMEVFVEGVSEETELLFEGRHEGLAPEIDGVVYINDGSATAGELVKVEITDAACTILWATSSPNRMLKNRQLALPSKRPQRTPRGVRTPCAFSSLRPCWTDFLRSGGLWVSCMPQQSLLTCSRHFHHDPYPPATLKLTTLIGKTGPRWHTEKNLSSS